MCEIGHEVMLNVWAARTQPLLPKITHPKQPQFADVVRPLLPKITHPMQPQFADVANVCPSKCYDGPLLGRSSFWITDDSSARAENLLLSTLSLLEDLVFFEFEEVRVLLRLFFLFIGATGSGGGKRDFLNPEAFETYHSFLFCNDPLALVTLPTVYYHGILSGKSQVL
ncbi:hypothetical protein CEXT_615501 [Caerostris extrusa]|uniref:Uncharacterized protein n=1 Tax=Caerostris extrusa TaxID=172846 RepID=A0AAV4W9I7_CAEEX|nr:hypothetical protein CEXT_615501 [Caerostris extrusa]